MASASNMIAAGLAKLHELAGASVTYTEAGVSGQSVTALEIRTRARGDGDLSQDFVFVASDLTINDEGWRGAQITASDGNVFTIEDRTDAPGTVTFKAVRALQRS